MTSSGNWKRSKQKIPMDISRMLGEVKKKGYVFYAVS